MGFYLSHETLPEKLLPDDPTCGALAVFVGVVRQQNDGKRVKSLEYEAFDELAVQEGERVLIEAAAKFPIASAACVHRVGHLEIGDDAIRVEVLAGHRQEAFAACRWIVDEIKSRVPIWKKEHYDSGHSEWLNPLKARDAVQEERAFYDRQTRLAEVGEAGQEKLRCAKVLVVGAGGLGCAVLPLLAAAGVGTIGVCDGDVVEIANLHRQVLYNSTEAGLPKAALASAHLTRANPFIQVIAYDERLTSQNGPTLISAYNVIVDCTDSIATKQLLNRLAVELKRPLVTAAIYRYEGQLQVVLPEGPCMACLWPEPPTDDCVRNCQEVGVLGATPAVFGSLQAMEVLKLILQLESPLREGRILLFDLLSMKTIMLEIDKNEQCPVCGSTEVRPLDEVEIVPSDLKRYRVVDIRESDELEVEPLAWTPNDWLPMSGWNDSSIDDRPTLLVCHHGIRSLRLTLYLRERGHGNVYSLPGGTSTMRRLAIVQK